MNEKERSAYYAAFRSKDSRFDGRFFVGISSTKIYCRPVCRARLPKEENCHYFKTAAEAEKAGYRPCLLCRPELAPETESLDTEKSLAKQAARILEENCGSGLTLRELASWLECTDRHLRRVFVEEYHVTPIEYLQTCRLLLAKKLLTDTSLSVTEVAMAAGFGSLRRFHELFHKQYRLTPTSLRKQSQSEASERDGITAGLSYRPPYQWEEILRFLSQRAIPGVEVVCDGCYLRTVREWDRKGNAHIGWVKVGNLPEKNMLSVTVSESLIPVLSQIFTRVRVLFDLHCDPEAVFTVLSHMDKYEQIRYVKGTRVPGCMEPFEMSVRAVLGQQITVKAASTLAGRIAEKLGIPVETGISGLSCVFPTADEILQLEGPIEEHLGPLGIIAARARTIEALAKAFEGGLINWHVCIDPAKEVKKLLQLPGIGPWTANYIAMRAMGWTDVLLESDYGVKKSLEPMNAKEIREIAEEWKPWRSYATVSLWNSLSERME